MSAPCFMPIKISEQTVGVMDQYRARLAASIPVSGLAVTHPGRGIIGGMQLTLHDGDQGTTLQVDEIVPGYDGNSATLRVTASRDDVNYLEIVDGFRKRRSLLTVNDDGGDKYAIVERTVSLSKHGSYLLEFVLKQIRLATPRAVKSSASPPAVGTNNAGISGQCSRAEALLWELLEAINSSQDPNKATGALLDALCALTGTERRPASFSTVTQTLNQRAAISAHWAAQLRAKVAASAAADKERERTRVVLDQDADDLPWRTW